MTLNPAYCATLQTTSLELTPKQLLAHRQRPVFRDGYCHTCWHDRARARARARRASRVSSTYGLVREQHEALYRLQGGRCPHGRPVSLRSPIDHDHASGQVRGILCDPCNRFLGYVGDRPEALLNLWAYLERPPAQVPRVVDHRFTTHLGLLQCIHGAGYGRRACGRLENEHQ